MSKLTIFWFRRDLRLADNHGLFQALSASRYVQPIFDAHILKELKPRNDFWVQFIHETLANLKKDLHCRHSDLWVFMGIIISQWPGSCALIEKL